MAHMLGVRVAGGHHYLEPDDDAARFLLEVAQLDPNWRAIASRPGDVIEIDRRSVTVQERSA